jgi:hypothetical protein
MTFRDDGFFDSGEWDQASDFTIQTWTLPAVDSPLSVLDGRSDSTLTVARTAHGRPPTNCGNI